VRAEDRESRDGLAGAIIGRQGEEILALEGEKDGAALVAHADQAPALAEEETREPEIRGFQRRSHVLGPAALPVKWNRGHKPALRPRRIPAPISPGKSCLPIFGVAPRLSYRANTVKKNIAVPEDSPSRFLPSAL